MAAAVHKTALTARDELIVLGLSDPNSPLQANTLTLADGRLRTPRGETVTIAELMEPPGATSSRSPATRCRKRRARRTSG